MTRWPKALANDRGRWTVWSYSHKVTSTAFETETETTMLRVSDAWVRLADSKGSSRRVWWVPDHKTTMWPSHVALVYSPRSCKTYVDANTNDTAWFIAASIWHLPKGSSKGDWVRILGRPGLTQRATLTKTPVIHTDTQHGWSQRHSVKWTTTERATLNTVLE